jgi:hypothetical protein
MKQKAKVAWRNEISLFVILPLLNFRALKVNPAALYIRVSITL